MQALRGRDNTTRKGERLQITANKLRRSHHLKAKSICKLSNETTATHEGLSQHFAVHALEIDMKKTPLPYTM